jgi:hypothetical protein
VAGQPAAQASTSPIDPALSPAEITELTKQAYWWGAQQVGFYELRYLFTQMEQAPAYRGLNRLGQSRRLFTAKERFATTPNSSTLYSGGFFDVSKEPVIVLTSKVEGTPRYWSVMTGDPYAHYFFVAGSQSTGNEAQRYVIVGPQWKGRLPEGLRGFEVIRATSDAFQATLRVAVTPKDEKDIAAALKVMDGFSMMPLSMWLDNGRKPLPLEQQPKVKGHYQSFPRMAQITDLAKSMLATDYLQVLSLVLNDASITKRTDSIKEAEVLRALAPLGLREGQLFDPAGLTPQQKAAVDEGYRLGRLEGRASFEKALIDMNGWKLQTSLNYDENDFALRAGSADIAWGSPVPYQSHTIGFGLVDADGKPLDGKHRYTLTFDVDKLPPVTDFWELPVYDEAGYFVDNPIDRYSATSMMYRAGHFTVKNGKLTFYLQAERPTDPAQARNWLPVPAGAKFRMAPRFYGATSALIDGSYAMPKIVRVSE